MSWFHPAFPVRDPIGPSAAWHCLHIRLHSMYSLFIAIIPCIPEYKAFSIIPFPDIIIAILLGTWSPLSRNRPYLRMSAYGGHRCWPLTDGGTETTSRRPLTDGGLDT